VTTRTQWPTATATQTQPATTPPTSTGGCIPPFCSYAPTPSST
jgi:hypothetical protein